METAAGDATDVCYRCGYALRGIAGEQPCPECGLLAERSRRVTDELHNTRPGWLRRLSWGVKLILLAIIVAAGWMPASEYISEHLLERMRVGGTAYFRILQTMPFIGLDLAALLLAGGAWLLTGREGYEPADRADRRLRRWLRAVAFAPLLLMLLFHVEIEIRRLAWVNFLPGSGFPSYRALWDWAGVPLIITAAVACVPLPLLLFRQFRNLAKRARSAHLAEHCTIVGVGTSLGLVYFGIVLFVFQNAEQLGLRRNWVGRSSVSLAMLGGVAVLTSLFLLWSLYLLIRFAIAFHKAARALRGKWQAQDRSVVAGYTQS